MADRLVETELKFLLSDGAAGRLEAMEGVESDLVSTYFDTPDFALQRRGATLRLRRDGEGWTQTLKAQGENAATRFEDERPNTDGRLDPALFSKRAVSIARLKDSADLGPVFETKIRRRAASSLRGGSTIELALDRGEIEANGSRTPVRELELELKDGEIGDLLDLARDHVRGGGLRLSFTSKAERGYRLAQGDKPAAVKFQKPELNFKGAAAKAFQALMLAALHQLCANAEILRGTNSLEAVHQARVALRHMKTFLGAFKHHVRDEGFREVKAIVDRLTSVFENARSLDVFIADTFRPLAEHEGGAAAFGEALIAAQTAAYAEVAAAVKSDAFSADIFSLAEWTLRSGEQRQTGKRGDAPRSLKHAARRLLAHRRKAMLRRAGHLDWRDARARHKLRIQAKKMRYLTEVFAEGEEADRFLKRLKVVQDHLGVLNDIATAKQTSWLALHRENAEAVFAAGVILGRRRAETPLRIKAARKAMRAVAATPAV